MKAAPTAMKALRCPELPTARKTTPMARTTAPGARDLAGELLGASVMRRTAQSSAARASASAEALCWADIMFSGSASAAAIGRSTTLLHECTPRSSRR